MNTMNAPVMMQAPITARGTLRSGLLGLATEGCRTLEADQAEDADDDGQAQALEVNAVDLQAGSSRTGAPCLNRMTQARARMQATDAASNTKREQ